MQLMMRKRGRLGRLFLLLCLPLAAWALASAFGFSPDGLLALRAGLKDWAAATPYALPAYVAAYAAAVAASIPGAVVFTLLGGFLFGPLWGGLAALLGASLGAAMVFLLAKGLLRDFFEADAGSLAARLAGRFEENAFSYLLFLRLVPVFPFFLVNIIPAFCAVGLPVFAAATLLGAAPAAFAFAAIGAGLDDIIARAGGDFSPASLATGPLLAGLAGLGILSLAPVAWRFWAARKLGDKE